MAVIVNGVEITDIVVIVRATGESTNITLFNDENGNIIFEKVSVIDQPNLGLCYMAYDSAGNPKYLVASGNAVSGTTYYAETVYADEYAVANLAVDTPLSGDDMAEGGPFFTRNPAYSGTPAWYAIGGSANTTAGVGVNSWSPRAFHGRDSSAFTKFFETASSQNGFLVLPKEFNGKPIKKLAYGAFCEPDFFSASYIALNPNLNKTTGSDSTTYVYTIIPDTVEEILNQNNGGLYFVNIPKNLRVLGAYNGGWLKDGFFKLEVPRTVTTLYRESFGNSPNELYFLHTATDTITLPNAGSNTGVFYNKTARNMTIYTDNETIKNYDYATDNVTATILHLDGTPW